MPDRIIVVNGMAGAGKTTLSAQLAEVMGATVVSKDAIKEALADAVGPALPTRELGALASDALWRLAGMMHGTVIVESVWLSGRGDEWFRRGWESVGSPSGVEVWCEAPRAVMRDRFLTRARHPAHDDQTRAAEWDAAADVAAPVTGFPIVRVDTGASVDVERLADDIRTVLV